MLKSDLVAPCGMNCGLCLSFQFREYDLNRHGFHRRYCPGCIPRGENCSFMAKSCELLKKGLVRFCFECEQFPCPRLKRLDERYRTKYHLSMIENLQHIKERGMDDFLASQEKRWQCPNCGQVECCHTNSCLACDASSFLLKYKGK
ncbi:MAG: DUF3795 domain-containing protein [Bacilli bacterium]|jgi:hypothetical protein